MAQPRLFEQFEQRPSSDDGMSGLSTARLALVPLGAVTTDAPEQTSIELQEQANRLKQPITDKLMTPAGAAISRQSKKKAEIMQKQDAQQASAKAIYLQRCVPASRWRIDNFRSKATAKGNDLRTDEGNGWQFNGTSEH